jgi:hypothetical protein
MAISVLPVILLPTMDSDRFERCTFSLQDRVSLLTVYLSELPAFVIHFQGLHWHRCTPYAECKPGLIMGCDMAVAEVGESPALKAYLLKSSMAEREARRLRHFRIYLGKGGCHEAFARSVYASGHGKLSRAVASFTNGLKLQFGGR